MQKIKVLHILWTGRTGGAERFVRDIVACSDRNAFDHAICFLAQGGPLAERAAALGVRVFELKMRHGFSVREGLRFRDVLKTFGPHIVHGHARNYLINILLIGRAGIRRVYSEHGGCFEPAAAQSDIERYRFFYRHFIRHYDLVLTNAEYLREKIIAWTGLDARKVKIYNYGIASSVYGDRSLRAQWHQQWDVAGQEKVVGIVGRLVEQKGIDDFIRVCAQIRKENFPCRFVVVGDGPLRRSLEELARQLKVEVLFLGDRQDLPRLLPAFDLFIVTSRWEPFGIVLLESLASGVPVIGFDVPGMRAVVEKGGGILLEGRDHRELARLAVDVLQDPDRYQNLQREGLNNVQSNFDVSRNINLLDAQYYAIVGTSFSGEKFFMKG